VPIAATPDGTIELTVGHRRNPANTSGRNEGDTMRKIIHRLRWEERGASTAEYAVTTMAAVGFAGVLLMLLRGDEVKSVLTDLVRRALTVDG
jgi:Flp pilus assembly pilin Flp